MIQNDDTISRQAAIEVLSLGKEILNRVLDDVDVVGIDREKYSWGLGLIESYINDIKELPSAPPERKTGKWLSHYEYCKKHKLLPSGLVAFWWCDQCEQGVEHPTNFCPNCGSYNGGEQDEYNH